MTRSENPRAVRWVTTELIFSAVVSMVISSHAMAYIPPVYIIYPLFYCKTGKNSTEKVLNFCVGLPILRELVYNNR